MANVAVFVANPVWQANGTQAWNLGAGDRDNCWTFSVRPFQANDRATLEAGIFANSDNNLNQSTDVVVTLAGSGGGGLIRLTATRVSP